MKRLLLPGFASIIRLTISTSSGVTDRLLYVMIDSILETIYHQEPERKLFLEKNYGEVENLIQGGCPVNGYEYFKLRLYHLHCTRYSFAG